MMVFVLCTPPPSPKCKYRKSSLSFLQLRIFELDHVIITQSDFGITCEKDYGCMQCSSSRRTFGDCKGTDCVHWPVLDGAGLDIDFHLASPEGRTLVFEQRKSDGVHTVETEVGDYMFCFDNTFSTISEKVIFFELILDNMGEQEQEQEDWKKYITGTDMLDMKLEDILESINSIKSRLSKSGHIQTLLRAFEARDRNIQESNFDRVNFWSMVNLVVMVVVSAIQVYMLKSLFEDKRKSRT
ncbi:PREDICTED: transmembrane emp24 domain-containing protein 5 isoform X1 [Myotis brandtii]|uniref:transmembrane emp24 domain-containing protein 5 isoform X1 n=1 Tax=Myotis brandtii TaxID=109478 RepID=UPI000703DC25|nr:PREDICTED: transmembrane emp24 domain-containing protein 5 isoform X1 [Myotis brandtii]